MEEESKEIKENTTKEEENTVKEEEEISKEKEEAEIKLEDIGKPKEKEEEEPPEKPKANYDYFVCPKCKTFPKIKLRTDCFVEISCKCFTKDDHAPKKTMNDPNIDIKELTKYRKYYISLEKYFEIIERTQKEVHYCDYLKEVHTSEDDKTEANTYCTECGIWCCEKCLPEFSKLHEEHILLSSKVLMINSKCETKKCTPEGIPEFYCCGCFEHVCSFCKETEHKNVVSIFGKKVNTILGKHKIEPLNEVLSEEKLSIFLKEIAKYTLTINTENDNYERYYDYLGNSVCIKKFGEKRTQDELIIKFFCTLMNAYGATNKIINFNARNNLAINSIKDVYEARKKAFDNEMKNLLVEVISLEAFLKELKRPSINVEYEIENIKEPTRIFGVDFKGLNDSNCTLYMDGDLVPFSKEFLFESLGKHKLEVKMKLGKKVQPVTDISAMFYSCSALTYANLSNFNSSFATNSSYMFSGCNKLTSVDLSGLNTAKITDFHWMFCGCSSLTSLNLSSFSTSNVTDMACLFYGCKLLKSENLDISSFNTMNVKDMSYMFRDCASLTSLNVSHFDTVSVTNMAYMFFGCESLTSLDLKNFSTMSATNISYMFSKCSVLSELDISNFVISKTARCWDIFDDCPKLSEEIKEKYGKSKEKK
ncbi:MAG: BspA family leucine-rich repeat surface protein [archaeon]|nr:BspA family leucine-rich repeat surface protein [archaeon]